MVQIDPSVPRAANFPLFREQPLGFLATARAKLGVLFVLRKDGPIVGRTSDCSGVVAAFGEQRLRVVRSDIDTYGRLCTRARKHCRETLPHDFAQLISGQGVPPSNRDQWAAIYTVAGCRLAHVIEDRSVTLFIHIVMLQVSSHWPMRRAANEHTVATQANTLGTAWSAKTF